MAPHIRCRGSVTAQTKEWGSGFRLGVVLLLAALALLFLLLALLALFNLAATVGVLEAHRVVHLTVELLQRRKVVGLQAG
jgi:hypothetical protein